MASLLAEYGSAAAAWEAYPAKVARSGGEVDVDREFDLAAKYSVRIVTPADGEYPPRLKDLPGMPLALYVKGDAGALSKRMIALVGTRRASSYGLKTASAIAYDLSSSDWCVLSGLALGIDSSAHRGALDAGGITVGVLGSALDRFYPERNRDLAREIVDKGGAVVSQFPFGRTADTSTFPIRNHVVAALSSGVVAVECPARSGTLITTAAAGEFGRPVMAVPGRVDSRMSDGCNDLLRNGAVLVRNADDVIEVVSPLSAKKPKGVSSSEGDPLSPPYSAEEAMIMLHVDDVGVSLDEIVAKTSLPVNKVNALAMALRIKGFVRFLPGNRIATYS